MYCPICLSNTLNFNNRGVLHIIINGKQMDAGRVLYNIKDEDHRDFIKDLEGKIEEFLRWYSTFQNRESISRIELMTSDISCDNGCKIPMEQKFSAINVLIDKDFLLKILMRMASKYDFSVTLEEEK